MLSLQNSKSLHNISLLINHCAFLDKISRVEVYHGVKSPFKRLGNPQKSSQCKTTAGDFYRVSFSFNSDLRLKTEFLSLSGWINKLMV